MLRVRLSLAILAGALAVTTLLVLSMVYGMRSDADNLKPLFTQILPAGNCACTKSITFNCSANLEKLQSVDQEPGGGHWTFEYSRDGNDLGLGDEQCDAAFPGLFEDIHRAVMFWTNHTQLLSQKVNDMPIRNGMARVMLYGGKLYVLEARSKNEDHRRKIVAALHAMHRALIPTLARERPSNIEFVFSIEDRADDIVTPSMTPLWAVARRSTEEALWLMPEFGFWAWRSGDNDLGPYDRVVEDIESDEKDLSFGAKEKQLVWRGSLSFAPKLRRALLEVARDQPWATVEPLRWNEAKSMALNSISMRDHCKYMFIGHVEGISHHPRIHNGKITEQLQVAAIRHL